jgi:phosphodiesterase/alkaline phosphatase D-like protein
MATLVIPNTFTNGTPAVATEVNSNFNAVKTFAEGISSGTNIDDGAITFSKLDPNVSSQLTTGGDGAQVILGSQIFG